MKKIPKFLGYFNHNVGPNEDGVSWFPNLDYFTKEQAILICDVLSIETDEVEETYPDSLFEQNFLTVRGYQINLKGQEN